MAKEAEKTKEEKVEIDLDQNRIRSEKFCDTPGGPYYRMKMPIAYLAELSQLPEVRAERSVGLLAVRHTSRMVYQQPDSAASERKKE